MLCEHWIKRTLAIVFLWSNQKIEKAIIFSALVEFERTLAHIQLEDVYDPWHATCNNGHKKDTRIESMNVLYHKYTTASKIMGKKG